MPARIFKLLHIRDRILFLNHIRFCSSFLFSYPVSSTNKICQWFKQSNLWYTQPHSSQSFCLPRDPDQRHGPVDTDQSPSSALPLLPLSGASGFPSKPNPLCFQQASLLPHINYSLSPVAPTPSLRDPGGYRVREVRGRSPHSYPRHLSEVSGPVSEALRSCRATPTRPSGRQGRQGPHHHHHPHTPLVLANNGLFQSVLSSMVNCFS